MKSKKILILGASGMLGYTLFTSFFGKKQLEVYGTVRSIEKTKKWFSKIQQKQLFNKIDAENFLSLEKVLKKGKFDLVINCIGIVKQSKLVDDPELLIYTNALLPYKIYKVCQKLDIRLIHFSTDCVFNGLKGQYGENDPVDAFDLYGKTKSLGEVIGKNCVTIRTSIIGHELKNHYSLIDWFLSQKKTVYGYKEVIYSGFPTIEIAEILLNFIIPNRKLTGLYHLSAKPISKYQLLKYVSKVYKKKLKVIPDNKVVSDRSLIADKFHSETGYIPANWPELIEKMYQNYQLNPHFLKY